MRIESFISVSKQSFIQSFLDYCYLKKHFSRHTLDNYERDLSKLVLYAKNHRIQLMTFNKHHCREFISLESCMGQSNRTLCRRISAYRTFWDYLQLQKYVNENPWRLVRLPKIATILPKIIPTKAMISFLDHISMATPIGFRNRVICECLYGIGLRVSELTLLKVSDINLTQGDCRIIGKRDKERIAIIGDVTKHILNLYLKEVRPLWSKTNSKTLIVNRAGEPVSTRTIQRVVKQCSFEQGLNPPLTPHVLRHCYASDLYKGGVDISMIKELLGHDHVSTTEIYTHVAIDELKETITVAHPHG
ncbi:hypothetical protein CL658_04460 [bacterium]|nr:hypothetical protein [bacterium]